MPVTKEPNNLLIYDNRRPDDLTLLSWQEGKPLAWDVAVIRPSAVSLISGYIPGVAAEPAALRKCEKYANLPNSYIFQHIAFGSLGTLNSSAVALISSHGCKICQMTFVNPPFFFSALQSSKKGELGRWSSIKVDNKIAIG